VMVKVFSGDLVLRRDTVFNESIEVKGNIVCKGGVFDLTVNGDISAKDIHVGNLNTWNINALNISAWNINALDIFAWDINAWDICAWNINALDIYALEIDAININAKNINANIIICNSRIKKSKNCKTIAFLILTDRRHRRRKEVMPEKKECVVSLGWLEKYVKNVRKKFNRITTMDEFKEGEYCGRIEALEVLLAEVKKECGLK